MQRYDPHYKFLAACFGVRETNAAKYVEEPQWDWEELVRLAAREQVLPAMDSCVEKLHPKIQLPSEIKTLFTIIKDLNLERNEKILVELASIARLLNAAGMEPVALKGVAHLLSGVYPSSASRFLADIDLLLPESELQTAAAILEKEGYLHKPVFPVELMVGHSYPALSRPQGVEVDLHRAMGLGVCKLFLPAKEVLAHSTVVEVAGARIRIPSATHLVMHHIMHSQLHDSYRERVWPSLRTMYDSVLLQAGFACSVDWEAMEKRFRDNGQSRVLALYFLRVQTELGLQPRFSISLSAAARFEWWYRTLLRQIPAVRYVDPSYLFLSGVLPRTRRILEILSIPGGWKYLIARSFSRGFYARMLEEL